MAKYIVQGIPYNFDSMLQARTNFLELEVCYTNDIHCDHVILMHFTTSTQVWLVCRRSWAAIVHFRDAFYWRHNDHDGVSNHQPRVCLLNRLFGRISQKTSKLRVTGLCAGNSPGPVNSPHKWPVTRKIFHLMTSSWWQQIYMWLGQLQLDILGSYC